MSKSLLLYDRIHNRNTKAHKAESDEVGKA